MKRREIRITCDHQGCPAYVVVSGDRDVARQVARSEGWTATPGVLGDYCPEHLDKRAVMGTREVMKALDVTRPVLEVLRGTGRLVPCQGMTGGQGTRRPLFLRSEVEAVPPAVRAAVRAEVAGREAAERDESEREQAARVARRAARTAQKEADRAERNRRWTARKAERQEGVRELTLAGAPRQGLPWEPWEDALLRDAGMSARDVAMQVQRGVSSVQCRRSKVKNAAAFLARLASPAVTG